MAVTSAVVTGYLPTANSSYTDFVSSGFGTPDAAIVIPVCAPSGTNPYALAQAGIGFWTSGGQAGCGASSDDAAGTSNTGEGISSSSCVALPTSTGNAWQILASGASITDGLRITKSAGTTSVARFCIVVLLKGLTNASVGQTNLPSSGTSTSITDPGFKPDMLFVGGTCQSGTSYEAQARISFGVARNNSADAVTQGCVAWGDSDGQSTAQIVNSEIRDDRVLQQAISDSDSVYASVSSFDATGFSLSYASNSFVRQYCYLAVELPDPDDGYVGIIDSKTSTGTQAHTGTGFTPVLLGLFGTTLTAVNTLATSAPGSITIGAASSTSAQDSVIFGSEDGVGTSNTYSRFDTSNLLNLRDHADAVDAVAALDSFDADGFTLNYSDGSSSARKILAFAIGDSTAGGGGATGTLSVSLSDVTVSAAGALTIAGSASNTLAAVGLSGAGAVAIAGSASNTLGAATLSASGSVLSGVTGNLAQTLAAATLAGSGAVAITGSLAQTLLAAALSGAGAVAVQGAAANTLGGASLAASGNVGSVPITGDLAVTLSNLAAAGAGAVEVTGSLAQTLNNAALAAGGAVLITGSLAQALANAGLVAAGGDAVLVIGSLDGTLRAYPALSGTLELDAALVANLRLRQGT